ncbi:MAG: type II toxin-antitoxin system VapC family toxin [Deltaproteobacteria bacterium]|nr:type II toxin-antitoxin system VapC family toxin [Deltaproteobacteria bacterium]
MFLFDTDTISHIIKKNPPSLLVSKIAEVPPEQQFTTAINVGEMVYGACKKGLSADHFLEKLSKQVLPNINILTFDKASAYIYGKLRAELEKQGTPIGEPDLRIASIALSNRMVLITSNTKHFERIPGLSIENWLSS